MSLVCCILTKCGGSNCDCVTYRFTKHAAIYTSISVTELFSSNSFVLFVFWTSHQCKECYYIWNVFSPFLKYLEVVVAHKTFEVIDMTPLHIVRCSSLGAYLRCLVGLFNSYKGAAVSQIPTVIYVGSLWMNGHWDSATFGERRVVLSDLIWGMENCSLFLGCS